MIADLSQAIFAAVPLRRDGEFSVEIDPGEIDAARLDALMAAGMTRASIGVQDFDPEIQKAIGREQSFDLTRAAVDALRARGIASLNTDILFGLPDQTPERISRSVQLLLGLEPDRVALYGYAHVPWMARRQSLISPDRLPRPEERLDMFKAARDLFVADGYREIGIDHFALPGDRLSQAAESGTLRRNFQGYTDDDAVALVGIGASSISRFPQGYSQNAPATARYQAAARAGGAATARGHRFTGEDLLRARIIEALMCDFTVSAAELRQRFGTSQTRLEALFADTAAQFDGILQVSAEGLSIPPEARPLTRLIARSFDAYDLSKAGHSTAV